MITEVFKTIQRPLYWFLLQTTREDPWERYPFRVPLHVYGAGSRRQFSWYLEGELDTPEMQVESLKGWLAECSYVTDDVLFNERDVWQHPITFERIRRGDCEDFSLWTWRKLLEQGYEAEFVAGWAVHPGEKYQGHAWVQFEYRGEELIFDPVVSDPSRMVLPVETVREWYIPQVSVDGALSRYVYGGHYNQLKPAWLEASM